MANTFSFEGFAPPLTSTPLRQRITRAYRLPETECVPPLIGAATLPAEVRDAAAATARSLIEALRSTSQPRGVAALVQEFALSSREGVALMCLAEALLRIPDADTRDAIIRDKVAPGNWKAHIGGERTLFVNAAVWGLAVTGKLTSPIEPKGLAAALTRVVQRCGEPVIRKSVEIAMRAMGEQFVLGQTIDEALANARHRELEGFTHSYDMLGEAAMTSADADRYFYDYEQAIHAIGKTAAGRSVLASPGISIKLSALHPRYARSQAERVMKELLPRVRQLTVLAKSCGIGLNIDAEEADRLELSLDLLEALALDPELRDWDGLGFVVQAYGKRCPFVIDWIVDLAQRAGRRIMVRLVKGAYWDAEIKRAQVEGLVDFPVYTRKIHTDVAYIACARKLLDARKYVYPQFATHNAQTVAALYHMAGEGYAAGDYEFQCLHGMGEPLYAAVVPSNALARPCRIYAPVGTHETLLAYLVRRLLENGANSSFVNQVADPAVSIERLIADPAEAARSMPIPGAMHDAIALPMRLYHGRMNSRGLDLSDEGLLDSVSKTLTYSATRQWVAGSVAGQSRTILNPADHRDEVGIVFEASEEDAEAAVARAAKSRWTSVPVVERANVLGRAADLLESRMEELLGLIMREAGKSLANAVGEVREAVDFLRYYAGQGRVTLNTSQHRPVGPVAAISPWNFPLAIFTGQVAAALMAGNPVIAKPAEETPLIAAQAVAILHEAGVHPDALQLVPGDGAIGAALVAASEIAAVVFTGSTEVARIIQLTLAGRLSRDGAPIPLIAETGGQNAMIVDSSALSEQVVVDVLASAFDSAGQRCSALRVLCVQEEVAERTLEMLKGAVAELSIRPTNRLSADVGPIISAEARDSIERHVERMRALGCRIERATVASETSNGTFVPPTIIEIEGLDVLEREVFGPVLHVLRYRREDLETLIDQINTTGYALTFGLHTRLDETIEAVTGRINAGNIYVNRNMVGAVVGVQPFGGHGLSGTGPKAGGPLYLGRLVTGRSLDIGHGTEDAALADFRAWLLDRGEVATLEIAANHAQRTPFGLKLLLAGPVGEENTYRICGRGTILLKPRTRTGLLRQLSAVLATGNTAVVEKVWLKDLDGLPSSVASRICAEGPTIVAVLAESDQPALMHTLKQIASRPGPLVPVQNRSVDDEGADDYRLDWLVHEVSVSTNTAASGGNASLMAIA